MNGRRRFEIRQNACGLCRLWVSVRDGICVRDQVNHAITTFAHCFAMPIDSNMIDFRPFDCFHRLNTVERISADFPWTLTLIRVIDLWCWNIPSIAPGTYLAAHQSFSCSGPSIGHCFRATTKCQFPAKKWLRLASDQQFVQSFFGYKIKIPQRLGSLAHIGFNISRMPTNIQSHLKHPIQIIILIINFQSA